MTRVTLNDIYVLKMTIFAVYDLVENRLISEASMNNQGMNFHPRIENLIKLLCQPVVPQPGTINNGQPRCYT